MGAALTTPVKTPYISNANITFRSQGSTNFVGGLPGYTVLDNVWYNDRTFYMIGGGSGADLPPTERVITAAPAYPLTGEVEIHDGVSHLVTIPGGSNGPKPSEVGGDLEVVQMSGTTLFLNDGWPGSWSGYFMYYHFASEIILGSISVLSSITSPIPSEYKKPWNVYKGLGRRLNLHDSNSDSRGQDQDQVSWKSGGLAEPGIIPSRIVVAWEWHWEDGRKDGLSRAVAEGMVGKEGIIDPQGWRDLTSAKQWVYFERILIADRDTSHRNNPLGRKWYKMALDAYKLVPSPQSLSPMREHFLSHYNIPIVKRRSPGLSIDRKKVKAVYVDRQGSDRKFEDSVHQDLLSALRGIEKSGKAVIIDAKLEELSRRDQFALFADADIIFGVHGNGLTHEMWMPTGGIVIERENQTMPSDQWEPENGGEGSRLHDGSRFPLNVDVFVSWLQQRIDGMLE
uniref:Glycosyltransferase 61 catalytic domain-containing protein n=1 Tax=Kwoniella bestiolae CBS 10118 TaxID=1296100 RepID=A0A1B9GE97_9TREE|nr:hypothetical protein I302_00842 [Kwoniella bestiolae CBS 10118]OCF29340.1 hypothetical protein I302_00842 [Kwoniella bestiolae CBS 10118]